MLKFLQCSVLLLASLAIAGCSSFGKGVAEAFLESKEDTRLCEIWGQPFGGLTAGLEQQQGLSKVLMVHGVGNHLPGYSTQFFEKLAKQLDLTVRSKKYKDIALTSPYKPSQKLGNLRVNRLLSKDRSKEMLFYELTWSEITAEQKALLGYDNSGEYSFRRAEVNDLMKKFSNDTAPDPIIYLGESRQDILVAFGQSFCWMMSSNWVDLPTDGIHLCTLSSPTLQQNLQKDHYAFVSHSLGSRITIDGLQRIASLLSPNGPSALGRVQDNEIESLSGVLKNKEISIYMMSNQLPILQLGRKPPEVADQHQQYCHPQGQQYDQRIVSATTIIAFSDPNDLLSYAIPQGFAEKYLDSRLCIDIVNVNINVANIIDAFGLGKLANPLDAHIGYDTDDRVVALIAQGIGNNYTTEFINKRCQWTETID